MIGKKDNPGEEILFKIAPSSLMITFLNLVKTHAVELGWAQYLGCIKNNQAMEEHQFNEIPKDVFGSNTENRLIKVYF